MIVIPVQTHWTRRDVANDPTAMYLFTDNADRTSGSADIGETCWYDQKYNMGNRVLCYPRVSQAVIRGLPNAFPITTMASYVGTYRAARSGQGQWKVEDLPRFFHTITDDIHTIQQHWCDFECMKYSANVPFGQGDISRLPPELQEILNALLRDIGIYQPREP